MSRTEGQARILAKNELKEVFLAIKDTKHEMRNKAILMMSFKVGLRAKEIASITLSDVLTASGSLTYSSAKLMSNSANSIKNSAKVSNKTKWQSNHLRKSFTLRSAVTKGKKVDSAYLASKQVREALIEYLPIRAKAFQSGEVDNLFLTKNGKAFSPTTMVHLFMKMSKESGIEFSSHSGRRTLCTNLVHKGLHIFDIQAIMRHSDISTTMLYYQKDERRLGELMVDAQNGNGE
jgi:integrase/recombinase XerD